MNRSYQNFKNHRFIKNIVSLCLISKRKTQHKYFESKDNILKIIHHCLYAIKIKKKKSVLTKDDHSIGVDD